MPTSTRTMKFRPSHGHARIVQSMRIIVPPRLQIALESSREPPASQERKGDSQQRTRTDRWDIVTIPRWYTPSRQNSGRLATKSQRIPRLRSGPSPPWPCPALLAVATVVGKCSTSRPRLSFVSPPGTSQSEDGHSDSVIRALLGIGIWTWLIPPAACSARTHLSGAPRVLSPQRA